MKRLYGNIISYNNTLYLLIVQKTHTLLAGPVPQSPPGKE